VKSDHSVHLARETFVVRRDQRGAAFAPNEAEELAEHGIGGVLVEIACRLVGENERRFVCESPGYGDALLLAAGKLGRPVIEPLRQSKRAKQLSRPLVRGRGIRAVDQLRKHHILDRIELGQQVMELVDEPEKVSAEARAAVIVELGSFLAVQSD